jgi:hypothetical protein
MPDSHPDDGFDLTAVDIQSVDVRALQAELARLRGENSRLRAQLDGTSRAGAVEATSSGVPTSSESVESSLLSPRARVELFRRLFRGRTDTFPIRWHSATSGKSGYAPACSNEWVPGVCENPTNYYSASGEPASVTVDAAAFALNGASVAKVEFYDGQRLLGTVASAPYRFVWGQLTAGGYSIIAKVTDSNGMTSKSVPENFVVNQTLPLALTINLPAGSKVNDDHVNVTGTVTRRRTPRSSSMACWVPSCRTARTS